MKLESKLNNFRRFQIRIVMLNPQFLDDVDPTGTQLLNNNIFTVEKLEITWTRLPCFFYNAEKVRLQTSKKTLAFFCFAYMPENTRLYPDPLD